ncbi:hypothetical protein K435DRAFT_866572 [Dendrothele bispora CBS 962.96]|uniref:Uncharacterized protein n=1 Tax=Dendrothele bispora (strain CBS 962.96) TaxID=1314807 RepID=A0A4S8LHV2_DENBC|nr:hypothetical protein K435DRAFT_866572 [Dendrothele bispora CBS 962.96]
MSLTGACSHPGCTCPGHTYIDWVTNPQVVQTTSTHPDNDICVVGEQLCARFCPQSISVDYGFTATDLCVCFHRQSEHAFNSTPASQSISLPSVSLHPAVPNMVPSIVPQPSPIAPFVSAMQATPGISTAALELATAQRNRSCQTSLPQNNPVVAQRSGTIPVQHQRIIHPRCFPTTLSRGSLLLFDVDVVLVPQDHLLGNRTTLSGTSSPEFPGHTEFLSRNS